MSISKYISYPDLLSFILPSLITILLPGPTYIAGFLFLYVLILIKIHRNLSLALFQVFLFSILVGKEFFTLEGIPLQGYLYSQVPFLFSIPQKISLRFLVFIFLAISVLGSFKRYAKVDKQQFKLLGLSYLLLALTVSGQIFGSYSVKYKYSFLQMIEIYLLFPVIFQMLLKNVQDRNFHLKVTKLFYNFSLFALSLEGLVAIVQFILKSAVGLNIEGSFDLSLVQAPETGMFRSPGTLNHPNYLASFVGILLVLPIYSLIKNKIKGKKVMIVKIATFLGLISLLLSFSRWAWLSFALGMFLLVYFERKILLKTLKKTFKLNLWPLVYLVSIVILSVPIFTRFTSIQTFQGRIDIIKVALEQIVGHPLWGVGPGNSTVTLVSLAGNLENYLNSLKGVHNTFLMIAVENGIPAFIAFFAFFMLFFRIVLDKMKIIKGSPTFAYVISIIVFLSNSMFYPLLFWDPSIELLFLLCAMVVYRIGVE